MSGWYWMDKPRYYSAAMDSVFQNFYHAGDDLLLLEGRLCG
jgi:hypothetical protein